MAAEAGKGCKPRPFSVDQKTFDANWNAIFGKDKNADQKDHAEKRITDHSGEDQ